MIFFSVGLRALTCVLFVRCVSDLHEQHNNIYNLHTNKFVYFHIYNQCIFAKALGFHIGKPSRQMCLIWELVWRMLAGAGFVRACSLLHFRYFETHTRGELSRRIGCCEHFPMRQLSLNGYRHVILYISCDAQLFMILDF